MKNKKLFFMIILNVLIIEMILWSSSSLAADLKGGEKVYKRKCVICHGEQGQGGSALKINDPKVFSKTDEEIRKIIAEGGNGMPGYKSSLKPEEIDSLIAFLRSWGNK